MAKRGRKPQPSALKILKGTRADRKANEQPAAVPGRPEKPRHLDEDAGKEWDRMVELLEDSGVLSKVDGSALALYCSAYSRWLMAKRDIEANGLTVSTAQGGEKTSPYVTIAAACEAQMQRLLVEFGATPSARSRVNIKAEQPLDEFEKFLGKRQAR